MHHKVTQTSETGGRSYFLASFELSSASCCESSERRWPGATARTRCAPSAAALAWPHAIPATTAQAPLSEESGRKFYQVSTAALQSLHYGYEKVRIKQLLAQTHAVKFVYEVNFNKKQTVSVVYKQTQAVKTRECFVNASPWAR